MGVEAVVVLVLYCGVLSCFSCRFVLFLARSHQLLMPKSSDPGDILTSSRDIAMIVVPV